MSDAMPHRLPDTLLHVLGLVVRGDADGIAEVADETPAYLEALDRLGLAVTHPTGRWVATKTGVDTYTAQAIRPVAVTPARGIGLLFGQALQRAKRRGGSW